MESACFTIFSILLFFYCFGCHNVPWFIQFSKLLTLLSHCSSISGQFDIQKHWANSALKAPFKSLVLRSHAYNMTLCLWRHFVALKKDQRLRGVGYSPLHLLYVFRIPFPKNTSGRLLLKIFMVKYIINFYHLPNI